MAARVLLTALCVFALMLAGCSGGETETAAETGAETGTDTAAPAGSAEAGGDVLVAYPVDSFDGVVDREMLSLDADGCDGTPSLLAEATEPTTYRLYETGDLDIESSLIICTAKVRTHELDGDAMLEMWCVFPELGEFFSRGMDSTVSGTTEWTELRTMFRLEAGQNPDNVKINLVVNGAGRVWVDDIKLVRAMIS